MSEKTPGKLAAIKVELVEDWKSALKWSSTRLALLLAALYGGLAWAAPAIISLAEHWPEMAPYVLSYLPTKNQALGPFIGAVLGVIARVLVVRFPRKEGAS